MGKKPEILAPAGSLQGLKAAVAAGCDAVYIGGNRFGARAYADHPSEDEMIEAISYCHLHGVKLYMTVNTLLKSREIEESLFSFLQPYYEAGLDAVIVQDMGVLRFVSRHFPGLSIHASTQMTLTMGRGAEELKKYHVTRMVPARELSIDELSRMRRETDLELEVFVHGALCYCYSGQCLLSSMLGGRSGNRGRCAQPCRLPYKLNGKESTAGDYLLSPKELCNLPMIPELIELGVDSFKIEGRMKRPEYTAFVTSIYRKYTDIYEAYGKNDFREYLARHKEEWQEDLRKLAELYNRNGFTQGYLEGAAGSLEKRNAGQTGQMLAGHRPKHGGVLVGKVLSAKKGNVVYQTTKLLSAQDVVEFRDREQRPSYEYTIGRDIPAGQNVDARYQKGCRIMAGDFVYRTKDAALLEEIRELYLEKAVQVPVSGKFTAVEGRSMCLQASALVGTEHIVFEAECFGTVCEKAEKQPAEVEAVSKILKQTGNSPFYFRELEMEMEGELFLPVSALKNLRRQVLKRLEETIVSCKFRNDTVYPEKVCKGNVKPVEGGGAEGFSASVMLQDQLAEVLKCQEIQTVYLHTEVMGKKELQNAFYAVLEAGKDPWLVLPVIFRSAVWNQFTKEWESKDGVFSLGWKGFLVKNLESISFLKEIVCVPGEKIRLDHNLYMMNEEAYAFWREQGIEKFTLPLEATERELERFSFLSQSELLVYGKIPVMVSAQCIQSNLEKCKADKSLFWNQRIVFEDGKKREFEAVNYCRYCYNIIYQKEPLYLKEAALRNQVLKKLAMRYSFTTETGEETGDILKGTLLEKSWLGHFQLGIQ